MLRDLVLDELTLGRTESNRALRPHYALLPKSSELYRKLAPFQPTDNRSRVAGFYLQSEFNPLILAQGTDSFGDWETVRHEYVHRILHAHFDSVPTWADEGLAELFSTLITTKKNIRLTRSSDRTNRYKGSLPAFMDWKSFFATNNQELKQWILKGGATPQAYYAQAALLAEFTHFGRPELREGYWELINRSRYKPISELDTQLMLGLDFSELDKAIKRQLKRSFTVSRSRIQKNDTPHVTSKNASPSTTAAILAIAYTRSGNPEHAQSLLNQYQDLENPLWLAAKSETTRTLDKSKDALVFATKALDTEADDPFLLTFATIRLYNTAAYNATEALASLKRAHAKGDTSLLMYNLYFRIASNADIPFEQYAPLAKEGVIYHPDIEYADELRRIEVDRILNR